MEAIAHTKNVSGQYHLLREHLLQVAQLAAAFAEPLGTAPLGYCAGLLHDIGKFHPLFQQYLLNVEQNPALKGQGPDHKGAGAIQSIAMRLELLAFLIAGHHGGLAGQGDLGTWLRGRANQNEVRESINRALKALPELASLSVALPTHIRTPHEAELFIRLLFSALVDADFLDTERHFQPAKGSRREGVWSWADLWSQLDRYQQQHTGTQNSPVNRVRRLVYEQCCLAALQEPGFFRLTVPTGGGKTRSSMAFALLHAQQHHLQRIIYAIPYMSITEQTADVFRSIFPGDGVVLEHHSGIAAPDDPRNPSPQQLWNRLASENWDAPIVVTTTVQLFESLLANTPSACRKLHNLAGSVIILDEAQMLPTHVLDTILDVLQQLVTHYGTTVVLCTATQPALDSRSGFPGLRGIREIISDPSALFTALTRVQYQWPRPGECWTWQQVADRACQAEQVLVIVNTRADAVSVLQALEDPAALHLSTSMCGAHRRVVLQEVRRRLDAGAPCRLVSTQLIEAGVDVDFPLVLRTIGPFDSIAQAAGRCNREGLLPLLGTVIVFDPIEGSLPPGPYRTGTGITRMLLTEGSIDSADLALYRRYFEQYYRSVSRDEPGVQAARRILDYPEVALRFQMIQEETVPVIVPYSHPEKPTQLADLLQALQLQQGQPREIVRQLQPYVVALRMKAVEKAAAHQLVTELLPGLWSWLRVETYDPVYGLVIEKGNALS